MPDEEQLGAFSFAVLALVGRGGASPHDIVRLMREGSILWTTSESHFYAEPKRLARLGYLTAEKRPGSTRERTFYELTGKGRQALREWGPRPAAKPRIQHEAAVKIAAADFLDDDQAVLRSLAGLREHLESGYRSVENMEERVAALPQRVRYARLLNGLARRILDAQREWLDEVERELGPPGEPSADPGQKHNSKMELCFSTMEFSSSCREIENLIGTYAERVDSGDFASVGSLLAEAVFVGGGGEVRGQEAIEGMLRAAIITYEDGTPKTKHVTTNTIVDITADGGSATARSYFTVLQALPELPLQPVAAGRYHDRFEFRGQRWCFTERRVHVDLVGDVTRHLRT